MDGAFLIFILTLVTYVPLASVLLYVWWKYGRGEIGVTIARSVFLCGSLVLVFLLTLV
jgi:hypothetical protein